MTILAFGGEMGFFVPSDANAIEGTAALGGSGASYYSAFARGYSMASAASSYLLTPAVTAQTDFWFHLEIDQSSPTSSSTLRKTLELLDDSGNARVRLQTDWQSGGSDCNWSLEYWGGAAWLVAGTFQANAADLQTIDIHVAGCNTGSGSVDLYLSGTQRVSSGSVSLSSVTNLAQAKCWGRTISISAPDAFSQIIMASESTIGMRVGTIVMTGQGSTHTFTAGGFANIDELVYSDADEINSDTANQIELFTGTPVPSFTGYTIRALGIYARAKKSGTGPAQMQLALRSAGTTYFSATKALDFGYGAIGNVWTINPATSAAFLSSEIPLLEYGAKSIT